MRVLLTLLLLGACGDKMPTATIHVGGHPVRVEVAANAENRARGLMHRDSIGAEQGMLFIYTDDRLRSFWMKDTRIPLSIAFADRSGKIVRIADMTPLQREHTSSIYPARYALEMNRGWFADKGVKKGAMITDIPPAEDE